MHDAGYRTGLLGKYLNGYPNTVDPTFVPPGWDEWDSPTSGGNPYSEYNYRLNENGNLVRYGSTPQDYLVDVLSRKSSEFIQQKSDKPFFLYVAPYVPHLPATPAPRYADAPGRAGAATPSFNEADMSAEPQWLQNRPVLNDQQIATIDQVYRKRRRTCWASRTSSRTSSPRSRRPASSTTPTSSSPPTMASTSASTASRPGR
jgi:arylsulfatase A-like enzyme